MERLPAGQVCLFADDCLLYRTIEGIPDQLVLQSDLTKLQQWADLWGMQFNPGKCTSRTISHGTPKYQKFYTLCIKYNIQTKPNTWGLPSVVTYSGLNIFRTLLASAVARLAFYAEIYLAVHKITWAGLHCFDKIQTRVLLRCGIHIWSKISIASKQCSAGQCASQSRITYIRPVLLLCSVI